MFVGLKLGSRLPKKIFHLPQWEPYKMKNPFYFKSKILFVLKIFILSSSLFGYVENNLTRKMRLIRKSMTSQPDKQTIRENILTNISRNKGNRTMKFGQLIEIRSSFVVFIYFLDNI